MNTFIQNGFIKILKIDIQVFYNVTQDFYFK